MTFALAVLLSLSATAQNPVAKPALSPSQAVLAAWNDIGRKLIAMAEDFPEDKYDFKPVPVQRSFADQLLHVAGSNDLFTQVAKGQKPMTSLARTTPPRPQWLLMSGNRSPKGLRSYRRRAITR